MITDETLDLARAAADDLRRHGDAALADAVQSLVDASRSESLPTLPYLTTTRAGDLLGVSGQTIKNWVRGGKLAGYRLGGRIVIPREAVEVYVRRARASLDLEDLSDADAAAEVAAGRRR